MARREYVSFLGERRGDIGFGDRGRDPSRWVLLIVAVMAIALSVWWFGFRVVDEVAVTELVTGETLVPNVLEPSEIEVIGAQNDEVSLGCDTVVEEWTMFQGGAERTGCLATRPIENPRILWNTAIGLTGWRNSPVIEGDVVYVGSAGVLQFTQDRRDGIYSVDLVDGDVRWIYTTELDVNSVAVKDGIVIAVGDEGRVWALRDQGNQGTLLWLKDLDVGVFGDPLFLGDMVVITAGSGQIIAYDIQSGDQLWNVPLSGVIRGGASSDGEQIYAASDDGEIIAINLDGQTVWRTSLVSRPGAEGAGISATPTVTPEALIVSVRREDTAGDPALRAIDKATGLEIWAGTDRAGLKPLWANVRSSPAVAGDYVVFGEGYSNLMVVMDRYSGDTLWSVEAGPECFPHWPSTIVNTDAEGGAVAYLARHDGGLYAIDLVTQEIRWEIYLGDTDGEGQNGAFPPSHDDSDFCLWGPTDGNSILSSPAVSAGGTIVVGTLEGYLVAVGDIDSDS